MDDRVDRVFLRDIFEFVGKIYKEIRRSSIGKIFAPPYAIKKPSVWWRYIDGKCFVWRKVEEPLKEVLNEVNLDRSKEKVIFLDPEVTFKNGILSTDFSC